MKVLFLTYDLPYPLISGGKIRAYHLIKNLAKNHQITLFSYYRDEEQKQYIPELKKYCQDIFLFKRRPPWSWQNIFRWMTRILPFPSATYYSQELEKALVKELKAGGYDLVHFESFYPALYLPLAKKLGAKTLMGNENVEYQIYNRFAERKFFFLKWFLKLEVLRMRCYEEKLWKQADINITLSKKDAEMVKKVTKKECPIIPNGVDIDSFKTIKPSGDGKTIIFVGTLIYQANSDAMKYFLKEIYPEIKRQTPRVKFILVSWYKPEWLEKYLIDSSIEFIQDKETPAGDFFAKADVLVAPMRIASGTRIKILEAMAAGLPVVTTSLGIEGIEAKEEVVIADEPEDFANEVVKLLGDKKRRQELGKAGRALVEKLYDWEKISQKLDKIYHA